MALAPSVELAWDLRAFLELYPDHRAFSPDLTQRIISITTSQQPSRDWPHQKSPFYTSVEVLGVPWGIHADWPIDNRALLRAIRKFRRLLPEEPESTATTEPSDGATTSTAVTSVLGAANSSTTPSPTALDIPNSSIPDAVQVAPVFQIPSRVSDQVTSCRISDIYPLSRRQDMPDTIRCLRIKAFKNVDKTLKEAKKALEEVDSADSSSLWFTGLTLGALALSLTYFVPVIRSSSAANEFGPGIYAAKDLAAAAAYAHPNGAIMVFKDPDFQKLKVWSPDETDWNILTAIRLQLPLQNLSVPDKHRDADVIIGPISANQSDARRHKRFVKQSGDIQLACTSYESCKRLAASLVAIIYITA